MTVRELIDVCDDITDITITNRIELYGQKFYIPLITAEKDKLICCIDNDVNNYGELASKEVRRITILDAKASTLNIIF